MPDRLLTPEDVGHLFTMNPRRVLELRSQYGWPSVTFGRTIRFTELQVDRIIEMHTDEGRPSVRGMPGQTHLSRLASERKRARGLL